MEGETLKTLNKLYIEGKIKYKTFINVIKDCRVYARMSPDLKKLLVEILKSEFKI